MSKHIKIFLTEMLLIILICGYNKIFILAFLWVILHELSHIIVARIAGCKFFNMELHVFGAKANLVDLEYVTDKQKLSIYLAGPVVNILIAIILYIINTKVNSYIIKTSFELNVGLAIFNLLPAYPLDGARIYEILLSKKTIYKKAQKVIGISSYFVGIMLLVIGVLIIVILKNPNVSLLISAIIIIYLTKKENESFMYISMGNIINKRKRLIKNKYIENRSVSVYYKYYLVNILALVERNKFNIFYILDDEMRLIHILHEDELILALKTRGNITLESYIKTLDGK